MGNEPEIAYHMLVLGMIAHISSEYHIRSNRESGLGRYDVTLEPKDATKIGYIFEFKKTKEGETIESIQNEALEQIHQKEYMTDLQARGVQQIACIALVFHGKTLHTKYLNIPALSG